MSTAQALANFYVVEASNVTDEVYTLPWKARYIDIVNDSPSVDLTFKFVASQTYSTLKPNEAICLPMISRTVIITTAGAFRVRGIG